MVVDVSEELVVVVVAVQELMVMFRDSVKPVQVVLIVLQRVLPNLVHA